MRALPLTLITLIATAAAGTTVYKWVDENGVVHFSDQPHQNAEKVNVREPQTYPSKAAAPVAAANSPSRAPAPSARVCTIVSPSNDQMLMNTDTVNVSLRIDPVQQPEEQIAVQLDGQSVAGPAGGATDFVVSSLERGSHTLQVSLKDGTGRVACQSAVTFHVHQPSVLNPQNPTKPQRH